MNEDLSPYIDPRFISSVRFDNRMLPQKSLQAMATFPSRAFMP